MFKAKLRRRSHTPGTVLVEVEERERERERPIFDGERKLAFGFLDNGCWGWASWLAGGGERGRP